MSKLHSSDHIIDILKSHGFIKKSQKGSHVKFSDGVHIVIVPHPRKIIPFGTFKSILRQAGLTKEDF
ncbi:MAG: type II toxin-antitoxin system HicA family toxin [Gammaproteobacteria bacterium]